MRILLASICLVFAVGCGSQETPQQEPQSQRTRDSAVAESGLPGAGGVGAAMSVADSAAARRAREDSILREQLNR
jgi:hypothetical protein